MNVSNDDPATRRVVRTPTRRSLQVAVTMIALIGGCYLLREHWGHVAGAPFFVRGAQSIVHRSPNMWTLFGQILELRARSQTSAAIKSLLGLAPKTARRINPDSSEDDVPLANVHVGDRLRVRPGEKVPIDGVVLEGSSALDESMLTGDGLTTARAAGQRLGIDEVLGEVKPADRLRPVERLQREGRVVAMAGDGINDAPALANSLRSASVISNALRLRYAALVQD